MDNYCEFRLIYSSSGVSLHEVHIDENGKVSSIESQAIVGGKDKQALIEKLKQALLCAEEHEAIDLNYTDIISISPDVEKYNLK